MNDVIARLAADMRLRPSHVSLYVAMMYSGATDADVMARAKVSVATYYRCVRDLRAWGYLNK